MVGCEYSVLGYYIKNDKKIKIKHNKCGNIYEVKPANFINNNRRCPKCAYSKGEDKINNWLEDNNFDYNSQETFKDCLSPKGVRLRFDFAVYNGNEIILIEYNGKQHYEYVEYFHRTKEKIIYSQKCDQIKRDYCKAKGYKLIEISYKDKERIEEILSKELKYNEKQLRLFKESD